jgi:hypothetical protein
MFYQYLSCILLCCKYHIALPPLYCVYASRIILRAHHIRSFLVRSAGQDKTPKKTGLMHSVHISLRLLASCRKALSFIKTARQ